MRNICNMDMQRILYSKSFYVSIIFITIMAFALPFSGMATNLEGILGVVGNTASGGDDFMTTMLGTGVITILVSIILSIFISQDYAHGASKNIFSIHANKWDYIKGKMLSMAMLNAGLLLLYGLESMLSLTLFADGVTLTGGVLGLLLFLLEKWIASCTISSAIILIVVFTRNVAWGILGGFLISTGGLSMEIGLFADAFHLGFLKTLMTFTISGISQLATLSFEGPIFIKITICSILWLVVCCMLSKKTLDTKDIS